MRGLILTKWRRMEVCGIALGRRKRKRGGDDREKGGGGEEHCKVLGVRGRGHWDGTWEGSC